MNIKKIIDICKKRKVLIIYGEGDEQWISDGCACYRAFGLPTFDERSICATFDISPKKAEKMCIQCKPELPRACCFEDDAEGEVLCDYDGPLFGGAIPITTPHGIMFIDGKYLKPISDVDGELLNIYERKSENGNSYFAVKCGLMIVANIMPYDVLNEKFVEKLKNISAECEKALNKQKAEEEGLEGE